MGEVAQKNTPATDVAFARLIELVQMDEINIPNRSTLVPADIPSFDKVMEDSLAEEKPVVVIYPDGSEQLIEPEEVRALSAQRR